MATNLNLDSLRTDANGRVSFSGLGSGIDIQGTVDAIIQAKRIPIDTIEQRISDNQVEIAAFQDLKTLAQGLLGAVAGLRGAVSFDGAADAFQAKQAFASTSRGDNQTPSTASDVMGISVTNAAQATNHSIEVEQVAAAHKIASDSIAVAIADPLGEAGTFEINGQSITVAAGDTLLDLRDRINAANAGDAATGVTASVISISGSEQVLILTADDTGSDAAMVVADTSGTVLQNLGVVDGALAIKNELQAAQNAELLVDGLTTVIERQGNTIDDLFTGVTLNLFKAETGTTVEVDVERDLNQVKEAIVDFVDAYNELRSFINNQAVTEVPEGDESGAGVLAGTSALSEIRARLGAAVGGVVDGDDPALAVLAQIGITIQGPGQVGDPLLANTLAIDETALDEALVGQPDAVRALFAFGLSSSSPAAVLVGFDGNTSFSDGGYQLNVAYAGGAVVSANIGGAADGSDDGTVAVAGKVLTVIDGAAKGLKLLYTGSAAASGIQLDLSVGIGAKIHQTVDALVDAADGLIANEIESLEGQNTLGQERITSMDERLERERDHLLRRFVAMETALTTMNRLLDSLRQQIDGAFGKRD